MSQTSRSHSTAPGPRDGAAPDAAAAAKPRLAYVVSRFPKITETFVLYEMLAIEAAGFQIEFFPLLREPGHVMHPEARAFLARARFSPFLSLAILRANLAALWRAPRRYLHTLWRVAAETWGSLRFFRAAVALFPKTVYLARQMSNRGVEHVHAHFASHPALVAWVIHRLTGIPYSFTAHGSDLHRERRMLKPKVADAAFVVAISEYNRNLILRECGGDCGARVAERVEVIHCGVDTDRFVPSTEEAAETTTAWPLGIITVGTLHEVKGQTYLIDACAELAARGVAFTLDIVGDGPDEAALHSQVAALGLTDRVHFHGRQSREDVVALVGRADVLAAPSVPTASGRREGIPVVLMEAMSSGIAVVASRLSGIPELVDDGQSGLLTPPRDAGALTDALERLARDPALRRRLAAAGRDKVVRDFNLDRCAQQLAHRFRLAMGLAPEPAAPPAARLAAAAPPARRPRPDQSASEVSCRA